MDNNDRYRLPEPIVQDDESSSSERLHTMMAHNERRNANANRLSTIPGREPFVK